MSENHPKIFEKKTYWKVWHRISELFEVRP
jgi:hypothetical protein